MELALVGLPLSGKTTVFNALTGASRPTGGGVPGKLDVHSAVVIVPDPRLDALFELFPREKKVYAQITYIDIAGLTKGISEGGLSGQLRNVLSQVDGFLHVVRAFENPNGPHPEESIDPQRDLDIVESEFALVDLITVENRIARLKDEMSKGKNRTENARELTLLEPLHAALDEGTPLRDLDLDPSDAHSLRGYGLLSLKPTLVLLNMGEQPRDPAELATLTHRQSALLAIQAELEMEIAQLAPDEAAVFLEEYGIEQPMRERVIRKSYELLGVLTFFTIGDNEVRAWPAPVGITAQSAAGVIHTDMERGFIRAEIIEHDTLLALGGMAEARQAGKLRLEGKNYVIQDGDVMTVRFNV